MYMKLAKPIIVLTLICVISSALLGATYTITKDTIDAATKAATDAAMAAVLPGAGSFEEITVDGVEGVLLAAKETGGLGYAFQVQDKGFGGAYVVMVCIGDDGKITGTQLLDNSETPGLGSKTGEASFTGQFIGKDSALEGVETVTGATISSNAFIRCIGTAYQAYGAVTGQSVDSTAGATAEEEA